MCSFSTARHIAYDLSQGSRLPARLCSSECQTRQKQLDMLNYSSMLLLQRRAIRLLNKERLRTLASPSHPNSYQKYIDTKLEYVESLKSRDIAIETEKANQQHYEVDTDFMLSCMGKRAKYSCCLYEKGNESLDEAEGTKIEFK